MAYLVNLSADEEAFLKETPVLITILIAGADSDIDAAEIAEAKMLIDKNGKGGQTILDQFYQKVIEDFENNLINYLQKYPKETESRNQIISDQLSQLNNILPKLSIEVATQFYVNMKDLARNIAEASGGVLGYMAVDKEESKYIDLPMVSNPANKSQK
jgi:hypothetical protein